MWQLCNARSSVWPWMLGQEVGIRGLEAAGISVAVEKVGEVGGGLCEGRGEV